MKSDELKRPERKKAKSAEFEDINFDAKKKLSVALARKSSRSQDDLAIIEQQRKNRSEEFEKYLQETLLLEEKKNQQKSKFRRFLSSTFNKIRSPVNKLLDTKLGKILTGNALGLAITVIFSALAISGVFPPASVAAIPVAIASLGIALIVEGVKFYKTRSLRKLAQESDLLVQNRGNISKQQYLLKLDPKLAKAVEGKLLPIPNKTNDPIPRHRISNAAEKIKVAGAAIVSNITTATDVAAGIAAAATGNPKAIVTAVKTGVVAAAGIASSTVGAMQEADLLTTLKMQVNFESSRPDVPAYKNIDDLRKLALDQHIQTATLQAVLQDDKYFSWTPEIIKKEFDLYKKAVTEVVMNKDHSKLPEKEQREKIYRLHELARLEDPQQDGKFTKPKNDNKAKNAVKEALKDFGRVYNPLYTPPTKVTPDSPLTKALQMVAQPQVESSEKHLTKAVSVQEISQHSDLINKHSKGRRMSH
jgi:hypothetical protein